MCLQEYTVDEELAIVWVSGGIANTRKHAIGRRTALIFRLAVALVGGCLDRHSRCFTAPKRRGRISGGLEGV